MTDRSSWRAPSATALGLCGRAATEGGADQEEINIEMATAQMERALRVEGWVRGSNLSGWTNLDNLSSRPRRASDMTATSECTEQALRGGYRHRGPKR